MKRHISNVVYGVLDYAAYPAAMLLAAPVVLHNLGTEAYGMWSVMAAVVSGGSILAAGFGDANIREVSVQRGAGNHASVVDSVRALLGLNLMLATVAVIAVLAFARLAAFHIVPVNDAMQRDCIACLQLAAILIALRAVESVCISTQRAHERYGSAVRISVVARLISLMVGALSTAVFHRVSTILAVAAICNMIALAVQMRMLFRLLDTAFLWPAFDPAVIRSMLHFGVHSWLLAASGIVFGQLDRVFLGLWLGATPVAAYAFCTQITQPVFGLTAAGLHFLFPHLANRVATQDPGELRHTIAVATMCNLLFVALTTAVVNGLFPRLLMILGGGRRDLQTGGLFTPILWSTAMLGLSVTPTYVLYAFNRIRMVTLVNLGGSILCLAGMWWFGRVWGARGIACARVAYAVATLALYLPLFQLMRRPGHPGLSPTLCEEA